MKKILAFLILAISATSLVQAQTIAALEQMESGAPFLIAVSKATQTVPGWALGSAGDASSTGFQVPSSNATKFVYTNDDKLGASGDRSNEILVYSRALAVSEFTNPKLTFKLFFQGLNKSGKKETVDVVYDVFVAGKAVNTYNYKPVPGSSITGSNDWQQVFVDLTAIKGDQILIGFRYSDGGGQMGGMAFDDFMVWDQPNGADMAMVGVGGFDKFMSAPATVSANGLVANTGTDNVTAFDINWSIDGGTTTKQSISGVSLNPGDTYPITYNDKLSLTEGKLYELKFWVSNVNGSADIAPDNDDQTYYASVVGDQVPRRVLVEEYTNAYCMWCPRGIYTMREMLKAHESSEDMIGIAYHNKFLGTTLDKMSTPECDELGDIYGGGGQPGGSVDRYFAGLSTDQWEPAHAQRIAGPTPVDFDILTKESSYDAKTRELKVKVSARFATGIKDEVRIGFLLVEDNLTGHGGGWDQRNAYNSRNDIPEFSGAGDPIPNFVHHHVFRTSLNGLWGKKGSVTGDITNGTEVTNEVTYTVPKTYWDYNSSIVAFVALYNENGSREILNASEVDLKDLGLIGVPKNILEGELSVYPIPSNGDLNITYKGDKAVAITITNVAGQTVTTDKMPQGQTYHQMDLSHLNAGVYMVTFNDGVSEVVKKIILN